jgi:hypothetical protein
MGGTRPLIYPKTANKRGVQPSLRLTKPTFSTEAGHIENLCAKKIAHAR